MISYLRIYVHSDVHHLPAVPTALMVEDLSQHRGEGGQDSLVGCEADCPGTVVAGPSAGADEGDICLARLP